MSLGYPTTKNDIDSRSGGLSITLRNVLEECRNFKLYLDGTLDQDLIGKGYTQGEVTTLKSAFADLDKLARKYEGEATQTPAYDFRTFAKSLTGVA